MKVEEKRQEDVADIISTLVVVNRGNFVIECGRELQELTEAVQGQRTKPGKIVITLEMVPSAWRDDGSCCQVDLKPQVAITKPKKEHGKSLFYVTEDHSTFTAFLDYHDDSAKSAEFLSHRAVFAMTFDDSWKIWNDKNEKEFTQTDFAEFLEDNIADIADPPAASLLEVARDLKATIGCNFSSKVTPKNGSVQLSYTEQIDARVGTGQVEVPEFFTLNIPVYFGELPIPISARLRYRINSGVLKFHYKLYRKSEILKNAFETAVAAINQDLGVTVLLGSAS